MSERNMWEIEEKYYSQGIQLICGVDEAGRGPLAGPVCAAAVILPPNIEIPGLDDSRNFLTSAVGNYTQLLWKQL